MKSRKIKDKNEKYIPGLIARISSLRYKDEKSCLCSTSKPILQRSNS